MTDNRRKLLEEQISEKIREILIDPKQRVDKSGVRFSERRNPISYREACEIVFFENPDLRRQYYEALRPKLTREEERCLKAGEEIVRLIAEKMRNNDNLTYSEALSQVQRENRELVLIYMGRK